MYSITFVLVFALLLIHYEFVSADTYKIGVGRADCTGPSVGINFMGFVSPLQNGKGIHLRQFARAFIVDDIKNRVVFVSADMGMIGYGLRKEVLDRLSFKYGDLYNEQNVIISGTHTHQTPGGFMLNFMYDLGPFSGFVQDTFDAYASGLSRAIERAHDSIVDGKVYFKTSELNGSNRNRRSTAYLQNPQAELDMYTTDVDKTVQQLEFVRSSDNEPIGVFNWYAVHPTSLGSSNRLISSDNMGYAALTLEQMVNPEALPGKGSFVASMAATNLGDASPNGGIGEDMYDRQKSVGDAIANATYELLKTPGKELSGDINSVSHFLHMPSQTVEYTFENGTTVTGNGCLPSLGAGIIGREDNWEEFENFIYALNWTLPEFDEEDAACHLPKEILIPSGIMDDPYEWQPLTVQTQVAFIGPLVFAAVPAEFTTMSGRRVQRALKKIMQTKPNIVRDDVFVIIAGLSNSYSSYVTTPEEYMVQAYEGGFTAYGPYTLPIYVKNYERLLQSLVNEVPIDVGSPPPEYPYPRLSLLEDVPVDGGVFPFGTCVQQPPSSALKGTLVSAVFQSGHPRNHVRQEDTFLTVELKEGSTWKIIANDASWDTKFRWARDWSLLGYLAGGSHITVEWFIPNNAMSGTYKIRHFGNFKDDLGDIHEYSGESNEFLVV